MDRRYVNLILILAILAVAIWIDLPSNPGIKIGTFERTLKPVLGLDLRGGMQVLLRPPEGTVFDQQALQDATLILENRSNGLGVSEVLFQVAGGEYILGEFPGVTDTDQVLKVLKQTGQLEFVDLGETYLPAGTNVISQECKPGETLQPTAVPTPAAGAETTPVAADAPQGPFCKLMTGKELKSVEVTTSQIGEIGVSFTLSENGTKIFGDYSTTHIGQFLAIVLDGKIISAPRIESAITGGDGLITGNFTTEEANNLSVTLRYGSLPIALEVAESRVIGPTLGQDSLNKSLLAGAIGFIIVFLFMAIYYRIPGLVADVSIIIYALVTFALYKLIPVTLTLPGIAGFLLSTGSALDANILFFERMKEELRNGRTLRQAIDLGWKRAWSSIRDSNIATIITSIILFWFGSAYGATIVKGFAFTLLIGVVVSLLAAFLITRTLLSLVVDYIKPSNRETWFGA
ncbi:MAG: protein translocase subunit SecD [Anaerolineaceae bacterium]|nr:protein translocase subunit SecD [Anaerolineaceae bacterium]